jgi:hypothetical protein
MVTFFVKIDSASTASNTFQEKLLRMKNTGTFPELYNPVIFGQPTCANNTAISLRSPSLRTISWARFRRGHLFSAGRQSNAPFSRRFPGKLARPACGNPLPDRETFFEYQGLALSRLAFPALRRDANISLHDVWSGAFQSRKSPRNGGWIGSVKQVRLTLSQRGAAHKRSTITVLYGCPSRTSSFAGVGRFRTRQRRQNAGCAPAPGYTNL